MRVFFLYVLLACAALQGVQNQNADTAIFAGGCFWCVQHDFDEVEGVISTQAGYIGGTEVDPTYDEVSSGKTGHVEAVKLVYDPQKISYDQLVDIFFKSVDPTRNNGQFCDTGRQYRPIIFYMNANQQQIAQKAKNALIASNRFSEVLVDILPFTTFYPAEEYHQEYYKKNPFLYKFYRYRSGRDKRLKELWQNT